MIVLACPLSAWWQGAHLPGRRGRLFMSSGFGRSVSRFDVLFRDVYGLPDDPATAEDESATSVFGLLRAYSHPRAPVRGESCAVAGTGH